MDPKNSPPPPSQILGLEITGAFAKILGLRATIDSPKRSVEDVTASHAQFRELVRTVLDHPDTAYYQAALDGAIDNLFQQLAILVEDNIRLEAKCRQNPRHTRHD